MINLKDVLFEALQIEMPHLDNSEWIDLRIERYPISQDQKKELMKAIHLSNGVYAKTSKGDVVFDRDGQRQPKPGEDKSLPHLPDNWEQFAIKA
jgi:hypothetical protein